MKFVGFEPRAPTPAKISFPGLIVAFAMTLSSDPIVIVPLTLQARFTLRLPPPIAALLPLLRSQVLPALTDPLRATLILQLAQNCCLSCRIEM